jgi:hypothetical protein
MSYRVTSFRIYEEPARAIPGSYQVPSGHREGRGRAIPLRLRLVVEPQGQHAAELHGPIELRLDCSMSSEFRNPSSDRVAELLVRALLESL